MVYLFVEILLCLILAAILGGILGWLLRGLGFKSRLAALETAWRGRLDRATRERDELAAEHGGLASRLEDELVRSRRAHAECADKIGSLSERLSAVERDLEARCGEARTPSAPPEKSRGAEPEATVNADGSPGWLLSAPDGEKDPLQKIWGIGPVLERMLNDLGVFHFRQIARFSEADVAWVAENLQAFSDRIVRDNWVGQARDLHLEKHGTTP